MAESWYLGSRIIVALDVSTLEEAEILVKELHPYVGCFKIGSQLTTAVGVPQAVRFVRDLGGEAFLDNKFNDIPNTVGESAAAASRLGVQMFNVHASAGIKAMEAAARNKGAAKLLAVTVLTSLSDEDTQGIFGASSATKVVQFAEQAKLAGVDGIICSPQELEILQGEQFAGFMKVTPGVRPEWAAANDQQRFTTPGQAILAGATSLVIGRPITKPPQEIGSPAEAVRRIVQEIGQVLAEARDQG